MLKTTISIFKNIHCGLWVTFLIQAAIENHSNCGISSFGLWQGTRTISATIIFILNISLPLNKRNKLSQGLIAKAIPCHSPLQEKPIDFSTCVKSVLVGQTGIALQENTVKVFFCDPKHSKHNTSCWEMARHCWLVCVFLLEFHLRYAAYCCIAKCLLPCVFTLDIFYRLTLLLLEGRWQLEASTWKMCTCKYLSQQPIISDRKEVGTGPAVKPFQSLSVNKTHTWWHSQTLLCV